MNNATFALRENLKQLKLATIRKEIDTHIRQAQEAGTDYADFLLDLTTVELQHRTENRLKRRIREAYRLHKHIINSEPLGSYHVGIIYQDERILTFAEIEDKLITLLKRLQQEIKSQNEKD